MGVDIHHFILFFSDQIVELQLQLQLPEVPMFLDFVRQVELCQSRCTEILRGSITLKVGNLAIYVIRCRKWYLV